jgi:predicted kinase
VVVSGPPGSGKTRLAHAIAQGIPCPAICRDEIKEGMVHAHEGEFTPGRGDLLTMRTFPVFFEVLRVLLAAGVTVVAEAAFQDKNWRQGLEPLAELAELRIVHCRVSDAVARERIARRVTTERPRAAHADNEFLGARQRGESSTALFERISIPAPSIVVDTTEGCAPELAEIIKFINRR